MTARSFVAIDRRINRPGAGGEIACRRGQIVGRVLGSLDAPNAADAIVIARQRWPHIPVRDLGAHEQHELDVVTP